MTVAQKIIELANALGVDISDCKTGNVAGLINAITLKRGGEIANNQNIRLAALNLAKALGKEDIPLSKNIMVAIDQLKDAAKVPVKVDIPAPKVKNEKKYNEVKKPVEPMKAEEPEIVEEPKTEETW